MENLYRRNPSGSTRRNFLKGAGTLGLTLAAAGRARAQSASVVVINEDGTVSTNAVAEWGFSGVANHDPAHYLDFAQSIGFAHPDRFITWADGNATGTRQVNAFNPGGTLGPRLLLWAGTPAKVTVSMPMCLPAASGDSLAVSNGGANDANWTAIGTKIVALGLGGCTIRLGWEFNLSNHPWRAQLTGIPGPSPDWVPLFRRIVGLLRAVPGQSFKFDWCPGLTGSQFTQAELESLYPGDPYVDYIGMNCYNQIGQGETLIPAAFRGSAALHWSYWANNNNGINLKWLATFAAAHGKQISIPEWGQNVNQLWASGQPNDDPYFVLQLADWIKTHNVAYHIYFTAPAPSFAGGFDIVNQPLSVAAWKAAFRRR